MSRMIEMLEQSRLARVIEQVERGEEVDLNRVLTLQALDMARAGQVFLIEAIKVQEEADDRLESQLSST